jgi:dolichol-phosphate mannosyltransferase
MTAGTLPAMPDEDAAPKRRRAQRKRSPAVAAAPADPGPTARLGDGVWVVLPTYNEADNIVGIAAAIQEALPGATLLVVDDGSPDGTGRLADDLAAADLRVRVRHRRAKQGLGKAYLDGFGVALADDAAVVVQMDADWSHDPAVLPALLEPIADDRADLVIGSRYVPGGGVEDWGIGRRLISRGGSLFARAILGLAQNDLTGGFKAWRAATLAAIPSAGVHAGGYVFQIEMTYRASRSGARVVEVPIVFRDRRIGKSKMSKRIVAEALVVVVLLRMDEARDRIRRAVRRG